MKLKIEELKQKQAILRKVDQSVKDKLSYSVRRLFERMDKALKGPLEKSQDAVADYTVDHASVDEKGNLLMNGDKYSFTPEAKKKLQQLIIEEGRKFDATEIELDGYLIDMDKPGFERAAALFDAFDVEELTGILF